MTATLRADARRNRLAILEAAAAVFAEQGLDAGVAEIARRAGVGPATLFRHFATKDELVGAIIDLRMTSMLESADRAIELAETDPAAAFEQYMREGVELHVQDRGFLQAAVGNDAQSEHVERMKDIFFVKAAKLLEAAKEAGVVRRDLVIEDLGMAMAGAAGAAMKYCGVQPGVELRTLQIMLDGMRAHDAGPLMGPAPSIEAVIAARGDGLCSS